MQSPEVGNRFGGGVEKTGAEGLMGCQLQGDVLGNVGLKALPIVALRLMFGVLPARLLLG